ncbi:MAG TPA: TRCF domain-containing protein, partial [Candidatus Dormibacteraeota bacterium]|nr:TRCF domain-containing protein [Candidatus Dormibacteraeota bacterium]
EDELARIRDEIRDLYGEIPHQAGNLLALAEVRLLADRLKVRAVDYGAGRVQVRFAEDAPVDPQGLVRLASALSGASLTPGGVLRLELDRAGGAARPAADLRRIEKVRDLLKSIRAGDSMRPASQPTTVGPPNGDR